MNPDVRWKQRFNNYQKAFRNLVEAVELTKVRELTWLEEQGVIQSFEFTHELAWNVLKDYLEYKGFTSIIGSRDASRLAFKNGLVEDGEVWMKMIEDRNKTSHAYDMGVAREVVGHVLGLFFPAFERLSRTFSRLCEQEDEDA